MKMTKFERRRADAMAKAEEARKKLEADLAAIAEEERAEFDKRLRPIMEKIGKVAEEVVEKVISENPEIIESYRFRKRECAEFLSKAMAEMFSEVVEDDAGDDEDEAPVKSTTPAENAAPEPRIGNETSPGAVPSYPQD